MKNAIDIYEALKVFNKITDMGQKLAAADGDNSSYELCGLNAQTGFDGYTIILSDGRTSLTIYFHNKYQFDYPDNAAFDNFMARFAEVMKYSV
ncbi:MULTISPECIES: DUF3081 family protein [unclassified Shewanella]|uniref:DUF3081 family protein n=1 Tax=unclassified Shewanella TaxID=196818 RepID=UPI000C825A2C|nr:MULTISPECIES: DUF3081 family protein [unclassified Shewanella]MDO6619728.1 DUF3081 family protein [Shewanella sp. 6_MG-2023]MDO6638658.1 DUF3081 family protein [Shewanella sp. 5_MG-2023]MDO6680136.1 DUF3081 family protein [Shewanella sp. 4_MG-2023]PMG48651.1 hypothetical protein BCU91_18755 [Shewanella sp. 10N.286.52.B9]PMH86868.1 hypothetical protein BCU57_09390 [Shewanella sp. 10N.286.48.B5]